MSSVNKQPAIDPWSFLDYKPTFPSRNAMIGNLAPSWVGDSFRRLQAYQVYESYFRNSARYWLDTSDVTGDDLANRREYGDPTVIVQTYLSSLLGEDQSLVIDEAEGETPDPAAVAQLAMLNQWIDDEKFIMRLLDNERTGIKLGDAIYVLGWNDQAQRPKLRIYNPGFYFPNLDPENLDENGWPRTIIIAWDWERTLDNGQKESMVTRIRWDKVQYVDDRGEPAEVIHPGDDNPSTDTVWYSKGHWKTTNIRGGIEDLKDADAEWEQEPIDLQQNFIPVIHEPNTIAEEEHFGISVLGPIMQVFDDLISTDTDLQASSATTGSPPIAVSGASLPVDEEGKIATYGPGTVWQTGDGNATLLNTAESLDALIKYKKEMITRMSVNGRVPESLMGIVKPSEVPSGITLSLSFTPHSSAVREMRMVRSDKQSLLFKMVSRMFKAHGKLTAIFNVKLVFGSFLPADKKGVVDLVVQLLNTTPPSISTETAVKMLVEVGIPIDDAAEEVRRIRQNDFESADTMLTVTGDINLVRQRLGLPPLPEEQLPTAPGLLP